MINKSERGIIREFREFKEFRDIKEFRAGMRSLNSLNSLNSLIRCHSPLGVECCSFIHFPYKNE